MRTRLYVAAVIAGVAAVGVLVALVLGPGRFHPSPPSLADRPNDTIPGRITYADEDNCIVVLRASGADRRTLTCSTGYVGTVSWIDANTIGYEESTTGGPFWSELDLTTGASRSTQRHARPQPPATISRQGERLDVDREGTEFVTSSGGGRTRIFTFEGRGYERPHFIAWSPEGNWLLLGYRDELWVLSRDGAVKGTLAKNVRRGFTSASWWIDGAGYLPEMVLTEGPFGLPTAVATSVPVTAAPGSTVAPAAPSASP